MSIGQNKGLTDLQFHFWTTLIFKSWLIIHAKSNHGHSNKIESSPKNMSASEKATFSELYLLAPQMIWFQHQNLVVITLLLVLQQI